MIYGLIPARGGSKGIPKKNIMKINGVPLLHHTINTLKVAFVDKVFVSTDCDEIAECALSAGASVVDRPTVISQDMSQSEDALVHFAQLHSFDTLVFVQATSPLVQPTDINKGLNLLDKYDSVFSACKKHWIPRWAKIMGDNYNPYRWDIRNRPMRQDRPELYEENGAFYITSRDSLLETGLRYSGNIGIVEMPYYRSLQIDTMDDIPLIECMLKHMP